jgi:hypothetical protein
MKHVKFAEKSLLMDDQVADSLLEYAKTLAEYSRTDIVALRAISPDGNTVEAEFLLNDSSTMLVESTNSTMSTPDNSDAVRYMRERIDALTNPPSSQPEASDEGSADVLRRWDQDPHS